MPLLAVGVSHRTAPVDLREQLAVAAERLPSLLAEMRRELALGEIAVLSTCNRTEIYCALPGDAAAQASQIVSWLASHQRIDSARLLPALYSYDGLNAVQHMMRVASGLDSMVLGEPQILGQMKDAYAVAHQAGTVGKELERCFQQVFSVAKKVRTETAIGANPVSMAFAAVSLSRRLFSDVTKTRALLIGAGEMIELVARYIAEQGFQEIVVANRTLARGHALADQHGGRAITMEEIPYALERADMVISCTAAMVPVLGKGTVERALKKRRHRPLFLVDLAVPRDIEPEVAELDDVYLYTVDDLQGVIEQNVQARADAAREAEAIIVERSQHYGVQQREQGAAGTLRLLHARMDTLREVEVQKALAELARGGDPAETLQRLSRALTGKWLHEPSVVLRQAAAEGRDDLLAFARTMFAVGDGERRAEDASAAGDEKNRDLSQGDAP